MLISLSKIIEQYNMKIRGIIHVGAHYGEEYDDYVSSGINKVVFIEACIGAYKVLREKFITNPNVLLFNCAAGEKNCTSEVYTETANQGQSNSLLQPAKHLEQYPSIQFTGKETVKVFKLDNFSFQRPDYNFINMDVQGYELNVLKGATKTLAGIDYIYTEVNRAELYKNCAMVEQLDEFLQPFGFRRVETNWGGDTWGDAVYLK